MNNRQINILGWILFIVSAIGFLISSVGNFWSMFGSIFFLVACLIFVSLFGLILFILNKKFVILNYFKELIILKVFLIPFFRKDS